MGAKRRRLKNGWDHEKEMKERGGEGRGDRKANVMWLGGEWKDDVDGRERDGAGEERGSGRKREKGWERGDRKI